MKYLVDSTLNKWISVKDIEDGAIVNEYYFNNEYICELINEIDGNLKVYKSDDEYFRYYFKSQSAGGITKEEMYLLKVMSAQGFISDQLSVKIAFPFTPAILLGLMIAIGYGDIMMIFTKNVILVI